MAIKRIGFVTDLSEVKGAKGKYLKATIKQEDGKEVTHNIFDDTLKEIMGTAYEKSLAIQMFLEKNEKGYWDITQADLVKDKLEEENTPQPKPQNPPETPQNQREAPLTEAAVRLGGEKVESYDKRDRSMAISYSKDCFCAGRIELDQLEEMADRFLNYILMK